MYRVAERQFIQQVVDLAKLYRWRVYHTWMSIRSAVGFPDLVLVRGRRLIFAELKSDTGKVTMAQQEWVDALRATCAEVYIWRPADWDAIIATLQ